MLREGVSAFFKLDIWVGDRDSCSRLPVVYTGVGTKVRIVGIGAGGGAASGFGSTLR